MINGLVVLAVANAFYWLGCKVSTMRANRVLVKIQEHNASYGCPL